MEIRRVGILGIDLTWFSKGSRCVVLDCRIDGKGLCAKGFRVVYKVYITYWSMDAIALGYREKGMLLLMDTRFVKL